jgi:cytochrome c-type biogenesis protein CcmH/NrfF
VEALISGLQTVATVVIWLIIVVLPIGLIIVLPIWLLVRLLRRRNRNKPQPAITAKEAQPK